MTPGLVNSAAQWQYQGPMFLSSCWSQNSCCSSTYHIQTWQAPAKKKTSLFLYLCFSFFPRIFLSPQTCLLTLWIRTESYGHSYINTYRNRITGVGLEKPNTVQSRVENSEQNQVLCTRNRRHQLPSRSSHMWFPRSMCFVLLEAAPRTQCSQPGPSWPSLQVLRLLGLGLHCPLRPQHHLLALSSASLSFWSQKLKLNKALPIAPSDFGFLKYKRKEVLGSHVNAFAKLKINNYEQSPGVLNRPIPNNRNNPNAPLSGPAAETN